jgi:glycosyltransferase involved in cell wall biosynthesis
MKPEQGPLLSIITVCLNDLENLKSTLGSITSQTYPNKEIIIIDGGSKDGSVEFIQSNANRISYWSSEPDKGLYDAMNKGIQKSKGDYILFLNAGDTFHNDQVAEYAMLHAGESDILYGDAVMVNKDQSYRGLRHKKLPPSLSWKDFSQGMVVCHQALFIKPMVIVPYDLKYKISADIDWAIRCLRMTNSVKNLGITICHFQAGGLSSRRRRLALKERWDIIKKHFGFWKALWSHLVILYKNIAGIR